MIGNMGTGTFDKFIGFLIRIGGNAWRKIASSGWPIFVGKITSYHYVSPIWGCDYGEYRYKYAVGGNFYRGIYRAPYINGKSPDARDSSSIGIEVQVRVCPNDSKKSCLDDF
jgi:hypothetical protein